MAATRLERTIQMVRIGLWPSSAVTDVLRESTVYLTPSGPGDAVVYTARDRTDGGDVKEVRGAELLASVWGGRIVIDPDSVSTFVVGGEGLGGS